MGLSKTAPRRVQALERRRKAMAMRRAGSTYQEIADALGCTKSRAAAIVREELAKAKEQLFEDCSQILQITADRLEAMLKARWEAAARGDDKAQSAVLAIIDRQARFFGLDAAKRSDVTLRTLDQLNDAELRAEAERLGLIEGGESEQTQAAG